MTANPADSQTPPEPTDRAIIKKLLTSQRRSLASTGVISLADNPIKSLKELGVQSRLTTLDISKTKIESLSSLQAQPWLNELIADGSQIDDYAGLSRHPQLRKVSLADTPLSRRPTFRLFTLIVMGSRLITLNSVPISKAEREQAKQFPKIARNLIEAGCDLPGEPVTDADYRHFAEEVSLEIDGVLWSELPNRQVKTLLVLPLVFLPKSEAEESQQAEELTESRKLEIEKEEVSADDELAARIAGILQEIGIFVGTGPQVQDNIVRALSGLVEAVLPLETCANDLIPGDEGEFLEEEQAVNGLD
jgi:hypothetical protein